MANSFSSLLDLVYPTGSIFWSMRNTSPVSLFGGQWSNINSNTGKYFLMPIAATSDAVTNYTESPKHSHRWGMVWRGYYSLPATWTSNDGSVTGRADWTKEVFYSTSGYSTDNTRKWLQSKVDTNQTLSSWVNACVSTAERQRITSWDYDSNDNTNTSYEQSVSPFRACHAWNRTS